MLKYYNFDIVFAEIPDEVTLAINITNCPNRCVGCHSPHLQTDIGECLDDNELLRLLETYAYDVTCVCFMGGDREPLEVERLAKIAKEKQNVKTAWYSGKTKISEQISVLSFDYIKIGNYDATKGPLNDPNTNQILYKINPDGTLLDITNKFWKK